MLKYPWLARSVHVYAELRLWKSRNHEAVQAEVCAEEEIMKQSGLWNSPGKFFPQGYYVFSVVDKPGIHEIWVKFDHKINIKQSLTTGISRGWHTDTRTDS